MHSLTDSVDVDFTSPCDESYKIDDDHKYDITSHTDCRIVGDDDLDLRHECINDGYAYILSFEIIKSGIKPFLRYKMINSTHGLTFEKLKLTRGKVPIIKQYQYMGLYDKDNIQYLFFMKNDNTYKVTEISSKNKYHHVLIHDIMNTKHHYGLNISNHVIDFFTKNNQFLFLEDENNQLVETPITGYRGDYYRKISVMAGLGMPRSGPYASLGPYYYFGSYERSLRYASKTIDRKPLTIKGENITIRDTPVYTKGGIVKYALFMGCSKVMLNLKDDPKDNSFESQKLASERKFIKDTLRLRDTNGTWTTQYDSVIQPVLEIYDRDLNIDRILDPQFTVKSYEQQFPLEYAYYKTDHVSKNTSTGLYNTKDIIML